MEEEEMKTFLRTIVRLLDWVSCIIPNMLMLEDCTEPPDNPIEYGMYVLGGLIVCACGAFGAFLVVALLICAVASYPMASCSIALALGLFIGIGYLRKKIGGKLK